MQYTEEHWDEDWRAVEDGDGPLRCRQCRRRGFYGPRFPNTLLSWPPTREQKYRFCKFCGFRQYVDKEPQRMIQYMCRHADGTESVDYRESHESWRCPVPECGRGYKPEQSTPWAVDNTLHPFRRIRETGTQQEFRDSFLAELGIDAQTVPHGYR